MFALKVSMHLKPYCAEEFTRTNRKEIIPILRRQKGFRDEVTFVSPDGTECVRNQFLGRESERGRLRPRQLSGSGEDPGESH